MDGAEQLLPYLFEPTRENHTDSSDGDDISVGTDDSDNSDRLGNEIWRLDSDVWCECNHCRIMPTVDECMCCKELAELTDKLDNLECITLHPDFRLVCLHPEVLRTGLVARWDIRRDVLEDPIPHRYVHV